MNPWRLALLGGFGATLAWTGWLVGAAAPGPAGMDLNTAAALIALTQLAMLVLLLPGLLPATMPLRQAMGPALLLVLLPWPLLVPPWFAGVPAGRLLLAQGAVLTLTVTALVTVVGVRRGGNAALPGAAGGAAAVGALQLAALCGLAALAHALLRGDG